MSTSIRAVPGVAKAEGDLWASGALVVDGELKKSTGGGGTIIATASSEPFKPVSNVDGRMPRRSGEVALIRATAEKHGLEPGDSLGIATRDGTEQVTVVGSYDFGSADAGGTDVVSAPLADIQRWFDREGEVTTINVAAEDGVSPEALVRRVRAAVPAGLEVRTGAEAADQNADEINDQIGSFLTPALLAFAGAALLVGAFIIFNTFTITVAERTREFAMLRTLGATRGQILGAVALEALVIGVGASGLGLVLGLGFAKVLASMFEAVGLGLPTGGAELAPRTIALSLGIGIGVTQLAALGPARRATRVPPIAALQGNVEQGPRRRWAPWIAGITAVLGVAMLVAGLFAGGPAASRLSMMAGGVVLLFVGVALSARWFVRPLAGAVGWPLERLFAEPGLLARENAMRNPGRTATTAAALMVGLGLVVFVAVFANGIKASFDKTVDQVVGADVVVRSDTLQPIPAGAGSVVAALARHLGEHERAHRPGQGQRQEELEHRHRHHEWRRAGEPRAALPGRLGEGRRFGPRPPARRHRARRGAVLEDARRRRRRCVPDRDAVRRHGTAARRSGSTATRSCCRGRSSRRTCSPECPRPATRG